MNHNLVSAVFDDRFEAERAATELRAAGVPDSALSVIARREGAEGDWGDANTHEVAEKGEDTLKGAVVGGGKPGVCRSYFYSHSLPNVR